MEVKFNKIYKDLDLRYNNFQQSCLIGCKFINCNLGFCSFESADLSYAIFEQCDLYNVRFNNAIMYATTLHDCDCTKTSFCDAYLNGIKTQNIFLVHSEFGFTFNTGKERKQITLSSPRNNYFETQIGNMPMKISEIEQNYDGIYCTDTNIAIQFIETSNDIRRVWLRKSEIAKTIKLILEQNGYNDRALDYYFYHRRFQRKSINNPFNRWWELFWGELFWGYGVKIINPIVSYFVNTIVFSIIYSILPYISFIPTSGMSLNGEILYVCDDSCFIFSDFLNIIYGSFLISSISVFGNIDVCGIARFFAVIQVQISILLLGLGVTALGKRMSNI